METGEWGFRLPARTNGHRRGFPKGKGFFGGERRGGPGHEGGGRQPLAAQGGGGWRGGGPRPPFGRGTSLPLENVKGRGRPRFRGAGPFSSGFLPLHGTPVGRQTGGVHPRGGGGAGIAAKARSLGQGGQTGPQKRDLQGAFAQGEGQGGAVPTPVISEERGGKGNANESGGGLLGGNQIPSKNLVAVTEECAGGPGTKGGNLAPRKRFRGVSHTSHTSGGEGGPGFKAAFPGNSASCRRNPRASPQVPVLARGRLDPDQGKGVGGCRELGGKKNDLGQTEIPLRRSAGTYWERGALRPQGINSLPP